MYPRSNCFCTKCAREVQGVQKLGRDSFSSYSHVSGTFHQKANLIFAGLLINKVSNVVVYKDVKRRSENTAIEAGGARSPPTPARAVGSWAWGGGGLPARAGSVWGVSETLETLFFQDCPFLENIYSKT